MGPLRRGVSVCPFVITETYPTTRGGRLYTKEKMGMMREGVKDVLSVSAGFMVSLRTYAS